MTVCLAAALTSASARPSRRQRSTFWSTVTSLTPGRAANSSADTGSSKWISTCRTARSRRSSTRSTTTMRPSRTMPTRSAVCCTSRITCEDMKTVCPAARASRTIDRNVCCTSGSSPLVGSSRISSSGACMNACTRPTFCRLPLDRLRNRAVRSRSRRSASAVIRARGTPPRRLPRYVSSSVTLCRPSTVKSPGRYPMRRRSATPSWRGSPPSSSTRPLVGRIRSSRTRMVVVLPAPLGPRKPYTSPVVTDRSRPARPRRDPYILVSWSVWMARSAIATSPIFGFEPLDQRGDLPLQEGVEVPGTAQSLGARGLLVADDREPLVHQLAGDPELFVAGREDHRVVGHLVDLAPPAGCGDPPDEGGVLQHAGTGADRAGGEVQRLRQLRTRLLRWVADEQPAQQLAVGARQAHALEDHGGLLGVLPFR